MLLFADAAALKQLQQLNEEVAILKQLKKMQQQFRQLQKRQQKSENETQKQQQTEFQSELHKQFYVARRLNEHRPSPLTGLRRYNSVIWRHRFIPIGSHDDDAHPIGIINTNWHSAFIDWADRLYWTKTDNIWSFQSLTFHYH